MNLDDIDPTFRSDLVNSHPDVLLTSDWVCKHWGGTVEVPKPIVRPTPEEREAYKDSGDFFWISPKSNRRFRMEVTGRNNATFTGLYDYAVNGKYMDSVILTTPKEWLRADPKPRAFFILNNKKTGMYFFDSHKTRDHWKIEMLPIGGRALRVFLCPTLLATFYRINSKGGDL